MQIKENALKSLSDISLTVEENAILKWIRSVKWEAVNGPHGSVSYKAKVPEFFNGARLYRVAAGGPSAGSLGPLELFVKKLGLQGVIGKQELYPVSGIGTQPRYISLKKPDLDNLGVGRQEEED